MEKIAIVYDTILKMIDDKASRFDKKHGSWLVVYCPKKQVVYMDTWNGYVYQAHCDKNIINDGYVGCQLHKSTHTLITDHSVDKDLKDAVDVYKTLLFA
jgi:hypothetical protein